MHKKLITALTIVLVAAAAFAGIASANPLQPGEEGFNQRLAIGQILSINGDDFIIEKPNGGQAVVQVTENTRYHIRGGEEEIGFEGLSAGMWVAVAGRPDDSGSITALVVVLLPEDFDPEAMRSRRVLGEVTHVNNGQDTFTILLRSGDQITFDVDDSTRYLHGLVELKDLEKGMQVGVLAAAQQDDNPLAKVVAEVDPTQIPHRRLAGKVESVSPESLSLSIRGGQTQTFVLNEETKFRSLDGSIEDIQDLESGYVVVVVFEGDETNGLTALNVVATGEALNRALHNLQRVGGEVQSAGGSQLTILTHTGEKMDFTVGENVHIRGTSGEADLNDLKTGMRVVVLYHTADDGTLAARMILFGEKVGFPFPSGSRSPMPDEASPRPPVLPEG